MNPEQWDALPWWTQHLYREGLEAERPWVTLPELRKPYDPLDLNNGVFGEQELEADLDELSSMGFKVTKIHRQDEDQSSDTDVQ